MKFNLRITTFSFYVILFFSLFTLSLSISTSSSVATIDGSLQDFSLQEAPPTGFCQTKTDYDSSASCSSEIFVANNMTKLLSYQSNFGLSNSEYKNLRITFPLSGENLTVHSPCEISMRGNQTHTAKNLCLDGKEGVTIGANSLFMSEKIHILAMEGNSLVKNSSVLRANELEIFSSVKTYINQGVRLDVRDNTRLVSTYTGDRYTGIRFGPGSMVESNNLRVIGHGVINLNSMFITARGSLVIESQGNRANNNISIDKKSSIKGNTISIISGNNFSFKDRSFLRSEQNSHVAASGCLVQSGTTMEAATYSGSCLKRSKSQSDSRCYGRSNSFVGRGSLNG